MPRRKKTTAGPGAKKGKRVNLSVRVASPKAAPAEPEENILIAESPATPLLPEETESRRAGDERQKQMTMWVGVTFFMALVLFVWIFNLKNVFKEQQIASKDKEQLDLNEISSQFNRTIEEVSASLNKFNELTASPVSTSTGAGNFVGAASSSVASSSESSQIEELERKLDELERRLGEATSTKSGAKTKK